MKKFALIVAGGSGIRMGKEIPKQFLSLAGKPILMHTIEKFFAYDAEIEIIVVLGAKHLALWKKIIDESDFKIPHKTIEGGSERFYSVKNGLTMVTTPSLVAIHDAVRPLVNIETITKCFETAAIYGNSIPAISPADSVRILTEKGNRQVSRDFVKLIQTPQVFNSELIIKAYEQEFSNEFTDDASVIEKAGEKIVLVDGNPHNIKITTPLDLHIAEQFISSST